MGVCVGVGVVKNISCFHKRRVEYAQMQETNGRITHTHKIWGRLFVVRYDGQWAIPQIGRANEKMNAQKWHATKKDTHQSDEISLVGKCCLFRLFQAANLFEIFGHKPTQLD